MKLTSCSRVLLYNMSASQEISCLSWNLKVHFPIHKSLQPVFILSQMNPDHSLQQCVPKTFLILWSYLCLGILRGLFSSGYPAKILYAILISLCLLHREMRNACPSHPYWSGHANNIWRSLQIMKLFIMQYSTLTCHVIPLRFEHSSYHPQYVLFGNSCETKYFTRCLWILWFFYTHSLQIFLCWFNFFSTWQVTPN